MKKLVSVILTLFLVSSLTAVVIIGDQDIRIRQGNTDIPSGGSYNFADQGINTGSTDKFKLHNDGSSTDLNLTGTPLVSITGTDAAMFTVEQDPVTPVTAGTKTIFKIKFKPTSYGAKTATVSISESALV